ncbi:hypothetical protein PACILC2_42430 [Paenibacillus cisolokensis]|uniref:DNA/pantothenate metabolism flavoprotein C-terminal domain-containing protein n=1 Tax=Paenibacillus cisolokensis TaxID=1658519 RepID=A0ABQ4NBW2_9BACL|nr:hypothetical protein PACILC2_42430 [Paenibacillus cisolokensis]
MANNVAAEGAGFNVDTNIVQIYDRSGLVADLPLMSKREAAERIMQLVAERLDGAGGSGANVQPAWKAADADRDGERR